MTHQHHTTDLDTVRQALGGERRAPKQLSEALTGKPRIGWTGGDRWHIMAPL